MRRVAMVERFKEHMSLLQAVACPREREEKACDSFSFLFVMNACF